MSRPGAILAMSFPDCLASAEGMWYKPLLELAGFARNGFTSAGHAALCILDFQEKKVYFADFGRYITPFGYGRARSEWTDPEVVMDFELDVRNKALLNIEELLLYLDRNGDKTHGYGRLFASILKLDSIDEALSYIYNISAKGSIPYGPFKKDNCNCSRFVFDTLIQNTPKTHPNYPKIRKSYKLTPSTLANVIHASQSGLIYEVVNQKITKHKSSEYTDDILKKMFSSVPNVPERANHRLPHSEAPNERSFWLGGTGSGAWFTISEHLDNFRRIRIQRIEESGEYTFDAWFTINEGTSPQINRPISLSYDTNFLIATITQGNKKFNYQREEFTKPSFLQNPSQVARK